MPVSYRQHYSKGACFNHCAGISLCSERRARCSTSREHGRSANQDQNPRSSSSWCASWCSYQYTRKLIYYAEWPTADPEQADIIDETLDLFRANSLFRNFEIKGPADRLLIVLILFISDCLAKLGNAKAIPTQIEASKSLNTLSVDNFPIPGDANFPLNAHYAAAANRSDSGE